MASPQLFGVPAQDPAPSQTSLTVQALPSSHDVPLAFGVASEQAPVAGLQVGWFQHPVGSSTGWQMSDVPLHSPRTQWSPVVQALPSSHVAPKSAVGLVHWPVAGSQLPATWHWSRAVQAIGVPAQLPFGWQTSFCVHGLPSSQSACLVQGPKIASCSLRATVSDGSLPLQATIIPPANASAPIIRLVRPCFMTRLPRWRVEADALIAPTKKSDQTRTPFNAAPDFNCGYI